MIFQGWYFFVFFCFVLFLFFVFLHCFDAYLGKGFLAQVSTGFTCTLAHRWLLKRIVSGVNKTVLSATL